MKTEGKWAKASISLEFGYFHLILRTKVPLATPPALFANVSILRGIRVQERSQAKTYLNLSFKIWEDLIFVCQPVSATQISPVGIR